MPRRKYNELFASAQKARVVFVRSVPPPTVGLGEGLDHEVAALDVLEVTQSLERGLERAGPRGRVVSQGRTQRASMVRYENRIADS